MIKLKKNQVCKEICKICSGNGYVKIVEDNVHQCWECDSEGEYYVYKPIDKQTEEAQDEDI